MLTVLRIKNYALLRDVTLEFKDGLNILTGETGAGKSIIAGALNIAAGERGYTENIRTGEQGARVEAVFEFEKGGPLARTLQPLLAGAGIEETAGALIIKREINRAGRGKVFVNNSACPLSLLRKIGKYLIDIHGQHEHQSLLRNEVHIGLLDGYAGHDKEIQEINGLYGRFVSLDREIKRLKALENEKQEKLDIINYRINEIESASLPDDEGLRELYNKREIMAHASSLKESVNAALTLLSPAAMDADGEGAVDMLEKAKKHVAEIGKVDKKAEDEYMPILEDAAVKAGELKDFFAGYAEKVEFNPESLRAAEDRLDLIESLMKKFGKKTAGEIKEYHGELINEKAAIEVNEETIKEKENEYKKLNDSLYKKCDALSEKRQEKGKELAEKIKEELKGLGISRGEFVVEVSREEAGSGPAISRGGKNYKLFPDGMDIVEFLISLNPGEDVRPLVKIASGGEVSRIMLAIKNILSGVDKVAVMVFDEIDTGISGRVAAAAGAKLAEISKKKQLICITHLPQIAAYGGLHYSVGKKTDGKRTETFIKQLGHEERVREIAKLLSGDRVTDASINAAEELIGGK